MAPQNRTARKEDGTFGKGTSGNPGGRPTTAKAIRAMLRDEALAEEWAKQIRIGVETGDPKCLELYGKYALGPASGKGSEGDDGDGDTNPLGSESNETLAKVLELVKEE